MNSNEEHVRKLHEKLNLIESNPESTQKIKLTHIQERLNRTTQEFYQESEASSLKGKEIVECLKKIQIRIREQIEEAERMEEQSKIKINRVQKIYQRTIEKMVKERKDTEKKINVALEGFLIELTSAKTKSNSAAKYAIKEFGNLEQQLNNIETEIENEENSTKQISKKIYAQFSSQIEELTEMVSEERRERESEEEKIINRLEKMYHKVHSRIAENQRERDHNEQEVVNFLESIIEKIRYELIIK